MSKVAFREVSNSTTEEATERTKFASEPRDSDTSPRSRPQVTFDVHQWLRATAVGAVTAGSLLAATPASTASPLREQPNLESSSFGTDSALRTRTLYFAMLNQIWSWGRSEEFESGMDNSFTIAIRNYLKATGEVGLQALADYLENKVEPEMVAETLKLIGETAVPKSVRTQTSILVAFLRHGESEVRDGAIQGLELLGSPDAAPFLRMAVDEEDDPFLQRELIRVANSLERCLVFHSAQNFEK